MLPSAISCNVSQQPDLNLMIGEDDGLVFDTSFQFPTSIGGATEVAVSNHQQNRKTFQMPLKVTEKTHLVSVQP